MFDLPIDNLFNPVLLFWISFFYLVILFHSFGITRIWNRINGVELLFLSAVIGYIYYIASNYLIFPLIEAIKSLIDLLPTVIPSSLSNLNLQINYSEFAKLFVYLFITILVPVISYFIVIFSIYLVVKFIQYCLDPNGEIFPNYQRFITLKKIQFSDAIVFSIPIFFFIISIICLCFGGLINTTQNIEISWDIWILINTFLQIVVFFASGIVIYFFYTILKDHGLIIVNFLSHAINSLFVYLIKIDKKHSDNQVIEKPNKLKSFFQNHHRHFMFFFIFCLFLLFLNQSKQGTTSFIELFVWSFFLIIMTTFVLLPQKQLEWIREKLRIDNLTIVDSNSIECNKPFEKKIDYNLIDAPLEDPKEDQFLRSNFTNGIVHTILNRKDSSSFVIGIYGEWGEGKTSILNFIENDLKKNPDIICVRYNPWRYNDETQLLQNFFFTLADSLGRSLSNKKERIGEWFSKYAIILTPLSIGVGGLVELSPGEIFSNAGKAFSSVELDELKKRIEKILDDEQKKIVVFIDDIDRLDRQEIQMILKIVKLSADFRHTIYILALDEEMVASALSEKYGTGEKRIADNENGKKFLEKIIQVPLHLPKINVIILRNMCFEGIEEYLKKENIHFSDEGRQQFAYQFNQGFITKLKTPRLIKRYLNALSFSLPLMKNKINISDLLLIEAIRIFYASIFLVIRKNPDAFLGSDLNSIRNSEAVRLQYLKIVDSELEKLDEFDKENLKETLFYIFPRLKTLYANTKYGSEWDITWDEKQNIASKRYLDRYFAYTFPEGDISEQEVKNFIENMDKLSDDQIFKEMQKFISDRQSADLFLIELRKNIKKIVPDKRKDFAFILSQNSTLFPYDHQIFGLSPFEQLATFIREILLTINDEDERLSFSKSICKNSEPITFGFEFIKWIDPLSKRETDKKIFKVSDFKQLTKILIDRVKEISIDKIFFLDFPDFAPQIFYYWSTYGSKDEIESFLSKTFERDTSSAIAFLKCYLTKAWGANGPVRGNFPREAYNSIIKFCDPSIIYLTLEKKYGIELKTANYRENEDIDSDRQIAHQFAYLYYHKEEEVKSTEELEKNDQTESSEKKDIDKEAKIVKYLGKTIFSPIKNKIEEGRDFFERGYNIERYFYEQEIIPELRGKIKDSPNDFLKNMVHDPDIVLNKYLDKIKQMSDEYDNYSKRLEIINSEIFKQKDAIWTEFKKLCDVLNQHGQKFQNEERDYLIIFTLTIADASNVRNAQMYNFFNQNREQLRSFIMQSPMKDFVEEYSNLRDDYMKFSDKFLKVLTDLFREWQRKYYLEESEIEARF